MNTLIVDHQIESGQVLRDLLEAQGHKVTEAANGEEGLSATLEKRPDLIISDIPMPRLDGFHFCQAIISMSAALGLGLVAEGVESSDQSTLLLEMGCTHQQGYFHGHPLPGLELAALIKAST